MNFSKRHLYAAQCVLSLLTGCLTVVAALARPLDEILHSGELRIGTRVKPGKMIIDRYGNISGFQYELSRLFSAELGVKLEMIPIAGGTNEYYATADGGSIVYRKETPVEKGPLPEPFIFTSDRIDIAAENLSGYPWKKRFMGIVNWLSTPSTFFSHLNKCGMISWSWMIFCGRV